MPKRLKRTSGRIILAAVSVLLPLVLAPVARAGAYAAYPDYQAGAGGALIAPYPLYSLRDALLSFFAPMEGKVLSVRGGQEKKQETLTAAVGNSPVPVRGGMRFTVLKEGAEFYHPVTGKPLWRVEEPTGTAQATGNEAPAGKKSSASGQGGRVELKLLSGKAAPGDAIRISGARVRLLFYQLKNVSWGLSQQYFNLLKKTNRFVLLSSPLDEEKDAMAEGRRLKAGAVLVLSEGTGKDSGVLTQKLLWTSDGSQAMSSGARIGGKDLKYLTLGDKFFTPKNDTIITFNVPYGARMICLAGLLGNGKQQLGIASGHSVSFYNISTSLLSPALGGAQIKGKSTDRFLRVQAAKNLAGAGKDGIIVAARRGDALVSSVYSFGAGSFHKLWEGRCFLRWIDGRLYAQKAGLRQGYEGGVRSVTLKSGRLVWGGTLQLPAGVNIFGFSIMRYGGHTFTVAYDSRGFVNVYGPGAQALWKSKGSFGGFPESFKRAAANPVLGDGGYWSIPNHMEIMGRDTLLINRQYLVNMVHGLGYKNSRITVLRWNGASMQELRLGATLGGTIMDFAASKHRLMILASPVFGVSMAKILQGNSPFTTRLYMYPLEGE